MAGLSRVSQLYGKPVFNQDGVKQGEVKDVIIDLERQKIMYLLTLPAGKLFSDRIFSKTKSVEQKKHLIPYPKIQSISDILLLKNPV